MSNLLRYGLVSSTDNVRWKPLSSEHRYKRDAVTAAETEAELRERSDPSEWLAVFDYELKMTVWKLPPQRTP